MGEKRTFFDHPPEEVKDEEEEEEVVAEGENKKEEEEKKIRYENVKLTSLDIVAYAYLKEEIVNTSGSHEVKHLIQHYKNLVRFVTFIEGYLNHVKTNGIS